MALVCLCRGNFYWPPHTTILFCSIFLDKIVLDTLKSRYHRSAPLGIANITTRYFSLTKDAIDDMTKIFGACYSLVAITKLDTSQTTIMSSAFSACFSLVAVPQMNTSKVTNMKEMFYNCYSLTTAPKMDTSNVSSMEKMFYNCYALTTIPQYNTSVVTSMANMFQNCYSLITIPQMNTSKVTAMGNMFYNCREITHINKLDISKLLSTSLMFMSCNSLSKISFGGETIAGGTTTIAITDSFLSRTAIVELFSSLPTAANSAKPKLTLTGNPGVPDLTDEDKAIATAKGWTLTL